MTYDEAFDDAGQVRPPYEEILAKLEGADLDETTVRVNALLAERGVDFGGTDGHAFRVDPVPRVLTGDEWATLSAGLEQRVRALDAFLSDVYGERRSVSEGVVPASVIEGSRYLEERLRGVQPVGGARISLAGLDVVRGADGGFHVLEDNLRTPSGLAYAMAASDAVAEVLGTHRPPVGVRDELGAALRRCLQASAPHLEGELVLLTDGPSNSAYYEHARLATLADLELCEPGDLERVGDQVRMADGRRVRAVYRRTDDDRLHDEQGRPTWVADLLLEPLERGEVGLVNWFGNGVADDKHVYAYVDDLVRFFLDEEPRLPSVPTYDLADATRREEVLDRLGELVVKPRDGHGGQGVVVGPTATATELEDVRAAIGRDPGAWIAQDVVSLSTCPVVVDGRLEPRHVDLRPFVLFDGETATVPLGGLTRVALREGSMVVNSSQEGGGKATWVM